MATTDQKTVYQLLEVGADFDGEGFEVRLTRPAWTPGSRATVRRLTFVTPDVDPTTGEAELTMETIVDGREASRLSKTISIEAGGQAYRRPVWWKRVGRWFTLSYRFSSGTGSVDRVADDAADHIVDDAGNILAGKGETVRFLRLLGQTFGVQSLGSRRR